MLYLKQIKCNLLHIIYNIKILAAYWEPKLNLPLAPSRSYIGTIENNKSWAQERIDARKKKREKERQKRSVRSVRIPMEESLWAREKRKRLRWERDATGKTFERLTHFSIVSDEPMARTPVGTHTHTRWSRSCWSWNECSRSGLYARTRTYIHFGRAVILHRRYILVSYPHDAQTCRHPETRDARCSFVRDFVSSYWSSIYYNYYYKPTISNK